jgi:hypothetical protein
MGIAIAVLLVSIWKPCSTTAKEISVLEIPRQSCIDKAKIPVTLIRGFLNGCILWQNSSTWALRSSGYSSPCLARHRLTCFPVRVLLTLRGNTPFGRFFNGGIGVVYLVSKWSRSVMPRTVSWENLDYR